MDQLGIVDGTLSHFHEAAGILFGHNTFLFSRVLDMEDASQYNQCESAVTWLESIGSQFTFLSQLQIDAVLAAQDGAA
jgi:hypothetical protein